MTRAAPAQEINSFYGIDKSPVFGQAVILKPSHVEQLDRVWARGLRPVWAAPGVRHLLWAALTILVPWFALSGYRALQRYRSASASVEHTYRVIAQAQELMSRLKDAETGHRGYLLTGDKAFLEPYEAARRDVPQLEDELKRLILGDPRREQSMRDLDRLINARLVEMERVRGLFELGDREGAAARIRAGLGKRLMDEIRGLLGGATESERLLLEDRSAHARLEAEQSRFLIQLGGIVLFSIVVAAIVVMELDNRRRRRAALLVLESEARFRQMIDAMPQLVWSTPPNGQTDIFNQKWYEYTGLDLAASRAEGWHDVVHAEDRAATAEKWRASVATGAPFEVEYRLRRHDGQYRWFLARGCPVQDDRGAITRWYGTCTGIEDQKEAEQDLRSANEDLESFAFVAAHDLQEPIRNMTIHAQLLERHMEGRLDKRASALCEDIVAAGKRTSWLLRDLLAYVELSRGNEARNQEWVQLGDALNLSLENLKPAIQATNARVSVAPLPAVRGSRAHFTQLFQNLIGNALKYSGGRAPEIGITAERSGTRWLIRVADNGQGIPAEHHQSIFTAFKRLHGNKIPGSGIGLAICQRMVERMGGSIWVESSSMGKGSVFCLSLPAEGLAPALA